MIKEEPFLDSSTEKYRRSLTQGSDFHIPLEVQDDYFCMDVWDYAMAAACAVGIVVILILLVRVSL